MADEPRTDEKLGLGGLSKFPAEAQDLPEKPDPPKRRRWLYVGGVFGAFFGLAAGVPESPSLIRLPGNIIGVIVSRIPGMPDWVLSWVCPILGWGVIGVLAGWVLDDYLERRQKRNELFRG
jgi:hypothetical protein